MEDLRLKNIFNIPNSITFFRLFLVFSCLLFVHYHFYQTVLTLIVIVGILDNLDGILARKLNQTTRFGELLDQFADSVSFIVVLLGCNAVQGLPVYLTGLYLLRECWVSLIRRYAALAQMNIASNIFGKAGTHIMGWGLLFVVAVILNVPQTYQENIFAIGFMLTALGLSLKYISAYLYTKNLLQFSRKIDNAKNVVLASQGQ